MRDETPGRLAGVGRWELSQRTRQRTRSRRDRSSWSRTASHVNCSELLCGEQAFAESHDRFAPCLNGARHQHPSAANAQTSSLSFDHTLVATCEAREINSFAYLADAVRDHPKRRLDELLPEAWGRARHNA